ncbi:MAG: hypothetical protein J6X48_00390 [Lachnospiraceae bacterium]|nr:hypothetical protein [Lachnospiraceae bacterium]
MDHFLNEDSRRTFSSVSLGFGIASLATSIVLGIIPYFALTLGCFALIFSFISKGYYYKRDTKALIGMIFGIVSVVISVCIIVAVLAFSFSVASSELTSILPEVDSVLGDLYQEQFGFMPSDLFKYIFSLGGIINA